MKKGNYTDIQGVKEGGLIFNEKISWFRAIKNHWAWKKRFHVQILFCPMFQIKRKKMGKYLFTILKYIYLCVKF